MADRFEETLDFLSSKMDRPPRIGVITGTGLAGATEKIESPIRLPYEQIPHFPRSTTCGHPGVLVFGLLGGQQVVALEGRFHLYEGYSVEQIAFPIRIMARLGIEVLFIASAAGGLNPLFSPGEIMLVADHINLTGQNPLIGPNMPEFGPRFPDMSAVYDPDLMALARKAALDNRLLLREGVYVGVTGPSLETPAETRFLKMMGADAVGMSTVLEAIVAVHCGLRLLVTVAITNVNLPDCMHGCSLEEIIATANEVGKSLSLLWGGVLEAMR